MSGHITTSPWQTEALSLSGKMSWREIARKLNIPRSTVSDFLRKHTYTIEKPSIKQNESLSAIVKVNTDCNKQGPRILMIPDTQVKPGISTEYLRWAGEYAAEKKPDVIVQIGDFADMESLSSYDKGKKSAEGRRVAKDIQAAIDGMTTLLTPIKKAQEEAPSWKPRLVLTLGNHSNRVNRHVEANPELAGFLSTDSLRFKEMGWEVYPFLEPVVIGGVMFIHYFPNPMTGKPLGGNALSILKTVGTSVVQGHVQKLDVATRTLYNGKTQWAIQAGAFYEHEEKFKTLTGNRHWRGVIMLNDVEDGSFDPMFVSLDYLKKRYL